jgi:aromatic-L-amino-acid decarboxylase
MNPLALDPETMRSMGHRTVDLMVDMLSDDSTPALRRASASEMAARLPFGVPAGKEHFGDLLERLQRDVFPFISRSDHRGFFAFIPSCGTFPGALGDFMASALGIYAGTWMESAGPSRLELVVLDWFKEWIGYPRDAAGLLVSGGSTANMTALACARESLLGAMDDRAVAYVSDQSHSSLARAARLLGFRSDQVRVLPTERSHALAPATLAAAIDADVHAGRRPLFAGVNAGATNTGAVDPLPGLAEVCRSRGVWLHADAAYGGFAALTERGRERLAGIELTDSVTLDPHKWLYQSLECWSLLVRQGDLLRRTFQIVPDYMKDAVASDGEVNFADLGVQQSRTSRALKVWLSISYFGVDAFREAIDRSLDLALFAEERISATPELELTSPASLGIVCFRRRGPLGAPEEDVADLNAALIRGFEETGEGLVSSTRLRGKYTARMCCLNHTSGPEDVERVLDFFAHTSVDSMPLTRPATGSPMPVIELADLRDLPLFDGLSAEELKRVASWARELHIANGDVAARRWDAARDFYVLLEGTAVVERGGKCVAELGPGDFFGELSALDWAAGYSHARSTTVTATTPLRLLGLSPTSFEQFMRLDAGIADRIEAAARRRLAAA